jgi:hypothetical protein
MPTMATNEKTNDPVYVEKKLKRHLCVSLEPRRRNLENVNVLPLREFLEALWSHDYSS